MEPVEEVNRYIHTEIMGLCWHEVPPDPKAGTSSCPKCGQFVLVQAYRNLTISEEWQYSVYREPNAYPDYCSDDEPRWRLNEVLEKVDISEAGLYLRASPACLRSTAEEIARACMSAHQGGKDA